MKRCVCVCACARVCARARGYKGVPPCTGIYMLISILINIGSTENQLFHRWGKN